MWNGVVGDEIVEGLITGEDEGVNIARRMDANGGR